MYDSIMHIQNVCLLPSVFWWLKIVLFIVSYVHIDTDTWQCTFYAIIVTMKHFMVHIVWNNGTLYIAIFYVVM